MKPMVKIKGIEPLAFAPQMRRSTKLSYTLLYVKILSHLGQFEVVS